MPDLLVRLYALPDAGAAVAAVAQRGVVVRRANGWERPGIVDWVRATFTPGWAAEADIALAQVPPRCFVAVRGDALAGFACHDVTRLDFFGPMGVAPAERGAGVGAALTLATLAAMRDAGFAYAIIGGAGPGAFYARVAGATEIAGSSPGIYDASLVRRPAS